VKQELGALPSQQQLQYWQLADMPFDACQLQQLIKEYLSPRQVTKVARTNRSGAVRSVQGLGPDRVQQQYFFLAPSLHSLLRHVQQEQQRTSDFGESASSVQLLRVLRCLQLWEHNLHKQHDVPTLLQRLAAGRGSDHAAAADGVAEVLDMTADDEDDDACGAEQLQEFLAGMVDIVLVRERQGRQQGAAAAAAAARVKDEPHASCLVLAYGMQSSFSWLHCAMLT
jgi:hypothetical protein